MKTTKILLLSLLTIIMNLSICAQEVQLEWKKEKKSTEILLGTISITQNAGMFQSCLKSEYDENTLVTYSDGELYNILLKEVKRKYGNEYPNFIIREFHKEQKREKFYRNKGTNYECNGFYSEYIVKASVVIPDYQKQITEGLAKAIEKSFRSIREGSRMAIDAVTVASGINIDKATVKDMVVDILLDNEYKVVAKEYLEKLYEEQQQQQSGIYNEKTTVQDNNFSAVGYYVNVKVTETSVRVQVVNVSTGEYEGNATINF